jgi:transposase
MSRFPSAKHLASWAALYPGNIESAGKKLSGRTRQGNRWLKRTLTQSAWVASRAKEGFFAARFRRLAFRRGKKRVHIAIEHSMLLKHGASFRDLGTSYFDNIHRERSRNRLVRRLEAMGYTVTLAQARAVS